VNQAENREGSNVLKAKIDECLSELVEEKIHLGKPKEDLTSNQKKSKISDGKKETQEIGLGEVAKPKPKKSSAPFDPFGISPEFYIRGETETTSWVGCICTMIQIAVTIAVIIIYSRSFLRKEEASITILNIKSSDTPLLDLKENKQVFIFNHYIFEISPYILMPATAYYVEKNTSTGATTKKPLELKNCKDLKTDISDLSKEFSLDTVFLEFIQCLEFTESTLIGEEKDKNLKKYISVELNPCLSNCYARDFGIPNKQRHRCRPFFVTLKECFLTA